MRVWEVKKTGPGIYRLFEQHEQTYVENTGREEILYDRKNQIPDPISSRVRRCMFTTDKIEPGCMFLAYAILYRCFQSRGAADQWAKAAAWKFLYMRCGADGFFVSERHIRRWMEDEYESRKGFGLQEYAIY